MLKDVLGQDLAEGNHDRHIGIQSIELLLTVQVSSNPLRGEHWAAELLRPGFYR